MNLIQKAAHAERAANRKRIVDNPPTPAAPDRPSVHRPVAELNRSELLIRRREAHEQIEYWQGAKARALTEAGREDAIARIVIWNAELASITAALLTAPPPRIVKEEQPDPASWRRYIAACVTRAAAAEGADPASLLAKPRGNAATASARVIAMIACVRLGIPRAIVAKAFQRQPDTIDQLFCTSGSPRGVTLYAPQVEALLNSFGITETA
jgi:hypothetical protein